MVYDGKPYWKGWFGGTSIFGNFGGAVDGLVHQFCAGETFGSPVSSSDLRSPWFVMENWIFRLDFLGTILTPNTTGPMFWKEIRKFGGRDVGGFEKMFRKISNSTKMTIRLTVLNSGALHTTILQVWVVPKKWEFLNTGYLPTKIIEKISISARKIPFQARCLLVP